ncbi:MAG: hypothetical protein HYU66_22525, partial [Armatimonadetes bacterium]|nr:hypothetical protein [Armatimonadota bacterium]
VPHEPLLPGCSLAERYAAARRDEDELPLGEAVPRWLALLEETRDGEELARLRERLRQRFALAPALDELPAADRSAVLETGWRLAEPLTRLLDEAFNEWERLDPSAGRLLEAVEARAELALALADEARWPGLVQRVQRRYEAALRSPGDEDFYPCARALAAVWAAERQAGAAAALRGLLEQVAEREDDAALLRSRARTDGLEALAAVEGWPAALALAAGWEVAGWRRRALTACAAVDAAAAVGLARRELEQAEPRWREAARGQLADVLAAAGELDEAAELAERLADAVARAGAWRAVVCAAARREPERARAWWEGWRAEVAASGFRAALLREWLAAGAALAEAHAAWLPELLTAAQRAVLAVPAEERGEACAALCLTWAGLGAPVTAALALAAREARLPADRAAALIGLGRARALAGDPAAAGDLQAAWQLLLEPGATGTAALRDWSAGMLALGPDSFAEAAAGAWSAWRALLAPAAESVGLAGPRLLTARLAARVGELHRRRVTAYREEVWRIVPARLA